ncbi:hypothetical protein [Tsukamurella ocularis]|uniref:hypothetical protein n=1 Tax=Tsukamurella ocularis TaxID=1970234 RepID=UPI00216A0BC2|nr:hypothetical protein [Tsukamurella ocularis]MCS3781663.1 hypothetical protein [Tsukamurella ocularis]MCS3788157.1 hypothetical protein [Tsukamurella ocularis]MCS3851877.1 hypothetical protein [Tsukamurella ocularis]
MGRILTRAHLIATGWTSDMITAAVRGGRLTRLTTAMYGVPVEEAAWAAYRTKVLAFAHNWNGVVSHESAAALHDIPFLQPTRRTIHFTVDREGGGCVRGDVHVHARPLSPEDVTIIDGVRVTSRRRTALDVALLRNLERGVCAVDAVRLRRRYPVPSDPEPVSLADLREGLATLGRRRGAASARRAIELSVDCSESAGESLSRMRMLTWGLPAPALQTEHVLDGTLHFTDFEWGTLVGEFDGRGKYGDDGDEVDDALEREKARQELLERAGFEVVRWRWRALNTEGALRQLLVPALERHGFRVAA